MGHAMAQAVSYQPPTREAEVQSQASSCGTCGTTAGIYPNTSVFPSVTLHQFDVHGSMHHSTNHK